MRISLYRFSLLPLLLIGIYSCDQPADTEKKGYLIDPSIHPQVLKKIQPFHKKANANISLTITENDKDSAVSLPEGEPGLAFTQLIENSIAIECLNGIEDGIGFSLIISDDTTILRFRIVSNSDEVLLRLKRDDALQPDLFVPCTTKKIILANQPRNISGELIEGKIELESESFYEVAKEHTRKLKFRLSAFFQSEPFPVTGGKYKTLVRQKK